MTTKEVEDKYEITAEQATKMASILGYSKVKGKWFFPDDFVPVYIPDGRRYQDSALLPYLYMMDVIAKMWQAYDGYKGIDDQTRRTAVRELRKNGLIVLKDGADDESLDYRDYLVSLRCEDWLNRELKDRKQFLLEAINATATGITFGAVSAVT